MTQGGRLGKPAQRWAGTERDGAMRKLSWGPATWAAGWDAPQDPSLSSFLPLPSSFSPLFPHISPSSFAVACVEAFLSSLFILLILMLTPRRFSKWYLLSHHVDEFPLTLSFHCVWNLIIVHSVLFKGWISCFLSAFFFNLWEWIKKEGRWGWRCGKSPPESLCFVLYVNFVKCTLW